MSNEENRNRARESAGEAVGEVTEGILDGALEIGSAVLQGAGNVAISALECGGAVVEGVCSVAGDVLSGLWAMEDLHPIVAQAFTLNYLAVFAIWYFAYGTFAYRLVFERTRPWTPLMPFRAFCEDLALQLPGRKAAFIRKQVDASLAIGDEIGGYLNLKDKDWSHKNIRDQNLYAEVGAATLPGPFYAFAITAPLLYPAYFWTWKSFFPA